MRIAAVNLSPEGMLSEDFQLIRYLERIFPEHRFARLHAADLREPSAAGRRPDLALFICPSPSDPALRLLANFRTRARAGGIDLRGLPASFVAAPGAAQNFSIQSRIRALCRDLDMDYVCGLFLDVRALSNPGEQMRAEKFMRFAAWRAQAMGAPSDPSFEGMLLIASDAPVPFEFPFPPPISARAAAPADVARARAVLIACGDPLSAPLCSALRAKPLALLAPSGAALRALEARFCPVWAGTNPRELPKLLRTLDYAAAHAFNPCPPEEGGARAPRGGLDALLRRLSTPGEPEPDGRRGPSA